ncbi:hypothetical protein A9995_04445 [Erythrobacter sp. QSSC1-22B]|uniref:hypothetical protein n=1 Tax=Erythrobacter sp. QSSC1-22B TaxID=1860125 RepID=UPI000804A5CE|nr:hypothetical protein [Erythrobacter sp. QSSC1-22B]OBX19814.1 hypothetical protein A9995_04445 [Erythrobacter sp. QSSC1-22B]
MAGTDIAAGLLLAVLACALAFLGRRAAFAGAGIAAAGTLTAALFIGPVPADIALAGCWISVAIASLGVFWPRYPQLLVAGSLLFSAFAGLCAGLVLGQPDAGSHPLTVLAILPLVLAPAMLCIGRGWDIAPRILTSWLLSVAMLVGAIPYLVDHPGYVPDHRM